MWLTGFDAPNRHTMYLDKPMRGHGLMQAIARVNRVFKDKPGGLVVDYLGLANDLRQALVTYTESGGTGRTAIDKEEAVAAMLEKYDSAAPCFTASTGQNGLLAHQQSVWGCSLPHKSTSWLRKAARIVVWLQSVNSPKPLP